MSSERRFTDRDVRGNPDLTESVYEYLEQYSGEFEFLIDCKMRASQEVALTVGMIRGVLNCMRNDPRVSLPEPMEATVTDIRPRTRKYRTTKCDRTDPHHGFECEYHKCEGIPWDINRDNLYRTKLTVHRSYAVARYRREMVHLTASTRHTAEWYVEDTHAYGPSELIRVHIKLLCKYPSYLTDPYLLTTEQFVNTYMPICPHCTKIFGGEEV